MRRFAIALLAVSAFAQKPYEFWPGTAYDDRVPTVKKVVGHDPGERITPHAGIVRYFEALAAAAPARMKLWSYAETWQGRKLHYAAIGSETNIKRLPEIQAAMKKLADPRKTPEAEARKLIAGLPAVVWLGYGVHGNEISSPDAAMLTAYHLLAARNDKIVDAILANTVVLIDPQQNPDGRDRFVHHFETHAGLEPDPSQAAAEHVEAWPSGRSNHYLFDLNRDWFAMTQPETRGRVKTLREWFPLVFVDLHEMGSDSTYYFAPEADPFNPHLAKNQRTTLDLFGKNNAKWFDKYGFDYFTREVYDAFYPGYGASWPSYYGGIAMTYEQASVRGLVVRRSDEMVMHFRDSVRRHFVASVSTCETAAANREKLLNDFYAYRVSAIEEGKTDKIREYILPRGRDGAATDKLVSLLLEQGVEVKRATAAFTSGGREFAAGTYIVPLAQPAKRLIRTLLDPDTPMDEKFLKEQERRRARKLRDEIYDVTAWSLPAMFNVEAVAAADASTAALEDATVASLSRGQVKGGRAEVAYLVPWGSAPAGRFLTAALRANLRVFTSDKGFTNNGAKYPSGTLIVKVKDNPASVHETVASIAQASGAEVHATGTGWVEDGVNFGSRYVFHIRKPAIALAWDTPTSSLSAGATRFVLERQFGYPVTVIRTSTLAMADLSRYQVLILPDAFGGGYSRLLGAAVPKMKEWVNAGGTLIGLADAVGFLADSKVGLLALQQENLVKEKADEKKPDPTDGRVPGTLLAGDADFAKAIRAERELPDEVAGVLVRARIDTEHWAGAGAGDAVHALVSGRAIYAPIKIDKGVNAAYFESVDKLLAGGYLWAENKKQLAYKPLVVVQPQGRGVVIGFTADPNFRAYLDGMNTLFLNAVFRGPAHARPLPTAEEE